MTSAELPLRSTSTLAALSAEVTRTRAAGTSAVGGEPRVDLLVAPAGGVGLHRQDLASVIDDRELVDQPFELRDEVGRHEDGPALGILA